MKIFRRISGTISTAPHWCYIVIFSILVIATTLLMLPGTLSDDQITYWRKAKIILESQPGEVWWEPNSTFSFFLAAVYRAIGDVSRSFLVVYDVTAILYLISMYWMMNYFIKNRFVAASVAIISLVPRYTLGMTYWGFGGFEFIKARILIMPLVPLMMSAYLIKRHTPQVIGIYMAAAISAVLSFESIYLGLIFCVNSTLFVVLSKSTDKRSRLNSLIGMSCFMGIAVMIYSYRIIMGKLLGSTAIVFEQPIYEHLQTILRPEIMGMTSLEYLRLSWLAARQAFWWALFPPSITDLGLFLCEHMLLIAFAIVGAKYLQKTNRVLFFKLIQLTLSVIIVAYGFQILRLIGRYLFGWPPVILEEVRAFKFILFVVYLFAGICYEQWLRQGRRVLTAISIALVLISPMQVLRMLPSDAKAATIGIGQRYLTQEKLPYLKKVLRWSDDEESLDIKQINGILAQQKNSDNDHNTFVMTTDHRVKLSGRSILVSYQDKRVGYVDLFTDEISDRSNPLILWKIAYEEIKSAVDSHSVDEVLAAADKYECQYVITRHAFNNKRLEPLYLGRTMSCYRRLPSTFSGA